ncbi:hypothetical protein FWP31_04695 [Vibrio cholerae]|nr:hypothetical protein [Vibrio cholerae]
MMKTIRRWSLRNTIAALMLAGSCASVQASDFVTGVAVGMMASDDKAQEEAPQSRITIRYNEDGLEERTELIDWDKWRLDPSSGKFLACPGDDNFYRTYGDRKKCRTPAGGFNGFLGGLEDYPEVWLDDYLAYNTGKKAHITMSEVIDAKRPQLKVTYQVGDDIDLVKFQSVLDKQFSAMSEAKSGFDFDFSWGVGAGFAFVVTVVIGFGIHRSEQSSNSAYSSSRTVNGSSRTSRHSSPARNHRTSGSRRGGTGSRTNHSDDFMTGVVVGSMMSSSTSSDSSSSDSSSGSSSSSSDSSCCD